jgi:hypothetical protein
MKKVLLTLMCMAAMMAAGTSLKAQEVTIVLMPGWTWISIPSTDTLDFATALGSFTPMAGDIIKSQWGNASYRADGQWRGSISQFYPGYGYMYKSTRTMPVMLTFNAQQPSPQVVVTTSEPMLITAISAMGGGEVTVSDGTYIIVKGLCWAAHENPTTNYDFYQEAESGVGSFSISMTDLNISTTYFVRAYAVTSNGTVYGDQKTFTTRDGIPTLTTTDVTSITGASATSGGNITDNGGLNITARGVCWSTSPNPTTSDSYTTNGTGMGGFSSSITGLDVSTTYYVRAYATTNVGTAYGNEVSFTTQDGIPTLTTTDVTSITGASATSGGNITDNGGLNVTARGVCWSTSPNPTTSNSHTTNGTGTGSFNSTISGLELSTTYYVRAYATTAAGTAYGEEKTFSTRDGVAVVTTAELTDIGLATATCGGTVTDDGGLEVTARGLCWSTASNPTIDNSHTTDGTGTGSFSSTLTNLMPNTTYYVRAYATNSHITVYGSELSFITGNPAYVDLGLPSGLLWATCNVGADNPEDYGDYFAWGETQPKDVYDWSTYQYCNGSYYALTKYSVEFFDSWYEHYTNYGYNGFIDNLTTLLPEDDAATANWGADWRMPTKEDWQELYQSTTSIWTTQNGVNGRLFTASNGNSLFLPAAGTCPISDFGLPGSYGNYWSSSLETYYSSDHAIELRFYPSGYATGDGSRDRGQSVRPVRCMNSVIGVTANPEEGGMVSGGGIFMDQTSCTVSATANEDYVFMNWTENGNVVSFEATYTFIVYGNRNLVANFAHCIGGHGYVDLGLPSGTLWAICNVGASSPEGYGSSFAWGETTPKSVYDWSTYQYCNGSISTLTKYCNNSTYGYNGYTDNLTTLLPEDDAATANWGSDWRMPTKAEWQEFYSNCTSVRTKQLGVVGRRFRGPNGNTIFLPTIDIQYNLGYWSSSLYGGPNNASYFEVDYLDWCQVSHYYRCYGLKVRPVRNGSQN